MFKQPKVRFTYAQFTAIRTPGTLANLIERYLAEAARPGSRPLGESSYYAYRKIQRAPLAAKLARELRVMDFIDYGRARRAEGVLGSTVNHDMSGIRVVLRHAIEVWEMEEISLTPWQRAKTQMVKQAICGKSRARTERHEPHMQAALLAYFAIQNARRYSETDMVDVYTYQLYSARRISETTRLQVKHIDLEKRLCWVYDLKNPSGKGIHMQFPLLGKAWDVVLKRLAALGPNPDPEAFLFDYSPKTVSQRFTLAKKACGFPGICLHGARRECASRMFEEGYSVPEVAMVTLHLNKATLLKHYTSLRPEDLLLGPAAKRGVPGIVLPTPAEKQAFLDELGADEAEDEMPMVLPMIDNPLYATA
jgi:integrase